MPKFAAAFHYNLPMLSEIIAFENKKIRPRTTSYSTGIQHNTFVLSALDVFQSLMKVLPTSFYRTRVLLIAC